MATAGITRPRWPARLALMATILGGLLTIGYYLRFNPNPKNTFDVFYFAAASSLNGPIAYTTPHGLYVYPPVTLLYFIPFVWAFPFETALLVQRLLSIAIALGFGLVMTRFLASVVELERIDRLLIIGCLSTGLYAVVVVVLGGIEIYLGLLAFLGFLWVEDEREARGGRSWALAALVKVFPAAWGVYFLIERRWEAIRSALMTGLAGIGLGVLVFGVEAHRRYIESTTTDRVRLGLLRGGKSPDNEMVTPVRPLSQLFPTIEPNAWVPVIALVVSITLGYIVYRMPRDRLDDRLWLFLAILISIEFIMPTSQDLDMYILYGPIIAILYTERDRLLQWAVAVAMVVFTYNIGRKQLLAVGGAVGGPVEMLAQSLGIPILRFASMPLYGMLALYGVCLWRARSRGIESS